MFYAGIGTVESPVFKFDTINSTSSALVFRGKRENVTSNSQVAAWMVAGQFQGLDTPGLVDSLIGPEDFLESRADVVLMRLPHEFCYIKLESALALGMGEDYQAEFQRQYGANAKPAPLMVTSCSFLKPSGILSGDVILNVDGKNIYDLVGLRRYLRGKSEAEVTVLRNYKQQVITAEFFPLPPCYTTRCLRFYGLHIIPTDTFATNIITSEGFDVKGDGCFIYWIAPGSPSDRKGIPLRTWLKFINSQEVNSIDDILRFLKESDIRHKETLIIRTIGGDGKEYIGELTTDDRCFPVTEFLPEYPGQEWIQHTKFTS
ncbi:serine protease [Arthrobotrys musiformis]|uniref:Serine protease n=1 Tax=Arthrobotrys musiformis TaxID=47236 RepID=A0AAV9VQR0_9PEZI